MKKLLTLSLLLVGFFLMPEQNLQANNKIKQAKQALCVVVGLGALASFNCWCAPTLQTIKKAGWKTAFNSTLIPRLMIDAGTMALSVMAFMEFDKKS